MTQLIAKPVVKGQYWVVVEGDKKVGNVLANNSGYQVKINGNNIQFKNTEDIQKKTKIRFQPLKSDKSRPTVPYPEYPTTSRIYNSMFDVKRKLHLYTKTKKSKCYYAAGWFLISQNKDYEAIFCPKYIFLQRYDYRGPFKTENEARENINT